MYIDTLIELTGLIFYPPQPRLTETFQVHRRIFTQPSTSYQAHLIVIKKLVASPKMQILAIKRISLPKTRLVRMDKTRKIHQKFRKSASSSYWRSVQDSCRDVFEDGGSRHAKSKLG